MHRPDDISVGVPFIDKWHRELISKLNNLRAAIKTQVCRYTIENAIAFLKEYSEVHFCEEERYMTYFRYADYRLHKVKHGQFADELNFLREELCNIKTLGLKGSYELSVETIQLITDWITGHVMQDDKKLGEFLREHSDENDHIISSGCSPADSVNGGTVTICSICSKIRGDKGIWKRREQFCSLPHEIRYSRGLCPECLQEYYADLFQEKR
jgi:hemerythrin-like metal-binding protein